MIELLGEFLLHFSIISLGLYFLRRLRKEICMALTSTSNQSSPSPSPTWINGSLFVENGASYCLQLGFPKRQKMIPCFKDNQDQLIVPAEKNCANQEASYDHYQKDLVLQEKKALEGDLSGPVLERDKNPCGIKQSTMSRKRPAQLILPAKSPAMDFGEVEKKLDRKEFQVAGKGFALASKKGKREVMEDGHGVMLDISGNPKQAFFVVIDGHGGRAAADFVAENLGRNIMNEIKQAGNVGNEIEAAIRKGYSATDHQFLNQGVNGGACAASVLVRDEELHVANVGDCKVVLSRKGVAAALTNDHRLTREDERARIENSGGFLDCRNGVWRVNGTLAVSRAIGDLYLKNHVTSEPDTLQLPLTCDCEFLIMASDGLWDKVGEQEAVDVVSSRKDSLEGCKELVAMASSRGGMDDTILKIL